MPCERIIFYCRLHGTHTKKLACYLKFEFIGSLLELQMVVPSTLGGLRPGNCIRNWARLRLQHYLFLPLGTLCPSLPTFQAQLWVTTS